MCIYYIHMRYTIEQIRPTGKNTRAIYIKAIQTDSQAIDIARLKYETDVKLSGFIMFLKYNLIFLTLYLPQTKIIWVNPVNIPFFEI